MITRERELQMIEEAIRAGKMRRIAYGIVVNPFAGSWKAQAAKKKDLRRPTTRSASRG